MRYRKKKKSVLVRINTQHKYCNWQHYILPYSEQNAIQIQAFFLLLRVQRMTDSPA